MNIPDLINASFEMLGGVFILNNCRVLYKDKILKGVSITSTVFFAAWGAWNTYFYSHLDQWASFYGGLCIFGANLIWIGLMIHYFNNSTKVSI